MKNSSLFLVCLMLAFGIWLVHNLSQTNESVVNVAVLAESNLEGRAERSSDAVTITARCSASGFRLLDLTSRRRTRQVRFDAEDLQQTRRDYFSISANKLGRYAEAIFGSGVSVDQFLMDEAVFRFIEENHKKVPVQPVKLLSFRSQYAQVGAMALEPDSVTVYGPDEILDRIDNVYTRTVSANDVRSNLHGEVDLEPPAGVRLSDTRVKYRVEVSRYVEIPLKVRISVHDLPAGVNFSVFPYSADVTLKCIFPLMADPEGNVDCYVDYSEFAVSRTGRCVVRVTGLPVGVLEYKVSPEVVECIEREAPGRL